MSSAAASAMFLSVLCRSPAMQEEAVIFFLEQLFSSLYIYAKVLSFV